MQLGEAQGSSGAVTLLAGYLVLDFHQIPYFGTEFFTVLKALDFLVKLRPMRKVG